MNTLILLLGMTLSPEMLKANEVGKFGTPYYRDKGHATLQERALVRWPGPSGLAAIWYSGDLKRNKRLGILLGGAAFHDPQLLPIYREALQAKDPRIRQAAAYGYRDLIGEERPNVFSGFTARHAEALIGELDAVASTLRQASLVEMWLASTLAAEGQVPPGWHGIIMKRPTFSCLRAVERVAHPEDLSLLVQTYELAQTDSVKIGLLRLIERFTLRVFLKMPQDASKGWASEVYEWALEDLDLWLETHCNLDPEAILTDGFEANGIRGVQPFEAQGCAAWLVLLDHTVHQFWPLAAEQVYACGGPAVDFTGAFASEDKHKSRRNRIREWYGN